MKVVLSTLNSKFIHSNLAIRYLKEYVKDIKLVDIMEFTINQSLELITAEIYKAKPDLIGFSTYIWNIEETLEICQRLKMVSPETKVLLGGPEVSFDGKDILHKYPYIDFIIYGEGEETFREFITTGNLENVDGLMYRNINKEICVNPPRKLMENLDIIPSPYDNIGDEYKNKIVYYESSRGCPFNCEFCLSSTLKGVRYFSIERVKRDIENLIKGGASQVKFVDRTFNANKKYSMEIMDYIMNIDPEDINFHFEVTAHLIDDDFIEYLKKPKPGLFQFEVGVQSTNVETIKAIGRITDFDKLKKVTTKIKTYGNIHQHLDLIAGLPFEDYDSFERSFNDVYSIRPEKLQLGFLKLLKGSGLRMDEKKYGFKYIDKPPYEVIENNYIDYSDVIKLKGIEDLVEKYYNEGYFLHSVEFIIKNNYNSPFKFYEDFSMYWEDKNLNKVSHSRNELYLILLDFYRYKKFKYVEILNDLLKYDYINNNRKQAIPSGLRRSVNNLSQSDLHVLLKNSEMLESYLYEYKELPTKQLLNKVMIEAFDYDILKIINNAYKPNMDKSLIYVLFKFNKMNINRYTASEITNYVREMI